MRRFLSEVWTEAWIWSGISARGSYGSGWDWSCPPMGVYLEQSPRVSCSRPVRMLGCSLGLDVQVLSLQSVLVIEDLEGSPDKVFSGRHDEYRAAASKVHHSPVMLGLTCFRVVSTLSTQALPSAGSYLPVSIALKPWRTALTTSAVVRSFFLDQHGQSTHLCRLQ